MLIDAHNHPNLHGYTANRIIQDMNEQGIDQAWLMTWDAPQSEYDVPLNQAVFPPTAESGIPLTEVLEVARQAPDRFVLGYAPHPKRPDAVQRIKSAVELYGVRVAGEYRSRVVFDDPDAIRLLRAFGELCLPVTIHLEYETEYGGANYPWRPVLRGAGAGGRRLPRDHIHWTRGRMVGTHLRRRPIRQDHVPNGVGSAGRRDPKDVGDLSQYVR